LDEGGAALCVLRQQLQAGGSAVRRGEGGGGGGTRLRDGPAAEEQLLRFRREDLVWARCEGGGRVCASPLTRTRWDKKGLDQRRDDA
jgi:hypothetical protein